MSEFREAVVDLGAVAANDAHGNPGFRLSGVMADVLRARGVDSVHLTMTHDAGVACAFVVLEGAS